VSDKKQGDFDLDEDLFDFGGVGPEPEPPSEENLEEIFASFRAESAQAEAAEAAPVVASPAAAPAAPAARPAPLHEEPAAPAPRPARAAPAPTTSVEHAAPSTVAHAPTHELAPAPRLARHSKGLVVIALSVTVLNAGLAVVLLRGRGQPERTHSDEPIAHAAPSEASVPSVRPAHIDPLPDPEGVTPSHGHPTLDEAREELARGDHAAARRRVYGLLAIVDRLEDPRKSELEAECQYLIAQSLHLEALARMGAHE